jgi:lectin, mannose-binding 1
MLRGFLNDGKTDFKSHHSVDSLAFGHCNYAYRNLGRLSQIKIKQDHINFRVEIDGNLCFESDKVRLPVDYTWGITAVSAEVPDTFEVYKMVVTIEALNSNPNVASPVNNEGQKIIPPSFNNDNFKTSNDRAEVPKTDADKARQEQQLADLQTSLQALTKQISDLQQRVSLIPIGDHASPGAVKALDKRLEAMELQIQHIKSAVADKGHIEDLKRAVRETHSSLLEAVPRHSFIIVVLLAGQALLVGMYFIYKRKRANTPKKYV